MKTMIKTELKRAFINPMLCISILIGCAIAIWQLCSLTLTEHIAGDYITSAGWDPPTMFNRILGFEQLTVATTVFYYMLPLLAALPFADSLFSDIKSGYIKNIFIRTKKQNYYIAKYLAAFLSAAVSVAIPLLLSLFLTAAFEPAVTPEPNTALTLHDNIMWDSIYFTKPLIYTFMYILLDAVFAGIWACLAISVSYFAINRFIVLIAPFIVSITIHALASTMGKIGDFDMCHLDVLCFLQPNQCMYGLRFYHVFICGVILFAVPLAVYVYRGQKDETF